MGGYITSLGSKVFSIVSGNTANMQHAIKDSATVQRLVAMHCLPHSANLCVGDVLGLFFPMSHLFRSVCPSSVITIGFAA